MITVVDVNSSSILLLYIWFINLRFYHLSIKELNEQEEWDSVLHITNINPGLRMTDKVTSASSYFVLVVHSGKSPDSHG